MIFLHSHAFAVRHGMAVPYCTLSLHCFSPVSSQLFFIDVILPFLFLARLARYLPKGKEAKKKTRAEAIFV
jgi:hypothetical protein